MPESPSSSGAATGGGAAFGPRTILMPTLLLIVVLEVVLAMEAGADIFGGKGFCLGGWKCLHLQLCGRLYLGCLCLRGVSCLSLASTNRSCLETRNNISPILDWT
jgi:hypothetical protein